MTVDARGAALNRLQSYANAVERADDGGHLDTAAPLYLVLALVEIGRALVEISETLQRQEAGA